MANCVFAGTFDPVTTGHKSIIDKCCLEYDVVFVVVGENPNKLCLFTREQRVELLKKCFTANPKVKVLAYFDLKDDYADFLKNQAVTDYVRGIRNDNDLKFEKQYEIKNQEIYPFITTKYIECDQDFKSVSSTLVKEQIKKEDYSNLPRECVELVKQFLQKN